jgi:predicted nucleotidyltransferase
MFKKQQASAEHEQKRQHLLKTIQDSLQSDDRFLAAWLTGSFARGEEDDFSDIDLTIVVAQTSAKALCPQYAHSTKEREELFARFGVIVNAHHSQQNGIQGAVLTSALYANGITVDWVLLPEKEAFRPISSRLLFEKIPIPIESLDGADDAAGTAERIEERISFFWMMAAVTAKSILRAEDLRFHVFYEFLLHIAHKITSLSSGKNPDFIKFSAEELQITSEDQKIALLVICNKIKAISKDTAQVRLETIELLLNLDT